MKNTIDKWDVHLENKQDFSVAMERIYAWYEQEVIDRVPIRFSEHNADFNVAHLSNHKKWASLKDRWFDAEYQLEYFEQSIKGQKFHAETFPVFWPNLGPEVFSAFYGSQLKYQEVTSYSSPLIESWDQIDLLKLDMKNEYFLKIEELTNMALERCAGKYLVGYTDLHPGVDCVAAWRDPQNLCMDLLMEPDMVKNLIDISIDEFQQVYDHFDDMLKAKNQPSVTWMNIPSFGKMHIPSCDFSSMIAPEQFEEFCLPILLKEVKPMTHNIFHCDGKGVANHLDRILEVPEINAIQWVQGMAEDQPIMQWVPLIKKIQAAGKSVIVDLQISELSDFMAAVDKKGIYLCIGADADIQPDIMKRVGKWA